MNKKQLSLFIIKSSSGTAIYLKDLRICGKKPVPEDMSTSEFKVNIEDLKKIIEEYEKENVNE